MALAKPTVAFDLPEHRVTADGAVLYACPNNELDFAQKIATLIDEFQDAGYKEVRFDASALASGIYIYRLVAGNYVSTKKMIVMK